MDVNSYIIILSLFTVFAFCYDTSFIQISCDDPGNETIEVSLGDNVNLQFLICLSTDIQTWDLTWERNGEELVAGNCIFGEDLQCSRYNYSCPSETETKYAMEVTENGNNEIFTVMQIQSFNVTDIGAHFLQWTSKDRRERVLDSCTILSIFFTVRKEDPTCTTVYKKGNGDIQLSCTWSPRDGGERAQLRFGKAVLHEYENNGTVKKSWRANVENRLYTSIDINEVFSKTRPKIPDTCELSKGDFVDTCNFDLFMDPEKLYINTSGRSEVRFLCFTPSNSKPDIWWYNRNHDNLTYFDLGLSFNFSSSTSENESGTTAGDEIVLVCGDENDVDVRVYGLGKLILTPYSYVNILLSGINEHVNESQCGDDGDPCMHVYEINLHVNLGLLEVDGFDGDQRIPNDKESTETVTHCPLEPPDPRLSCVCPVCISTNTMWIGISVYIVTVVILTSIILLLWRKRNAHCCKTSQNKNLASSNVSRECGIEPVPLSYRSTTLLQNGTDAPAIHGFPESQERNQNRNTRQEEFHVSGNVTKDSCYSPALPTRAERVTTEEENNLLDDPAGNEELCQMEHFCEGRSKVATQSNENIYVDINDLTDKNCGEASDFPMLIEPCKSPTKSCSSQSPRSHNDDFAFYHTLEQSESSGDEGRNGNSFCRQTEVLAINGEHLNEFSSLYGKPTRLCKNSTITTAICDEQPQELNRNSSCKVQQEESYDDSLDSCGSPALPPRAGSGKNEGFKSSDQANIQMNHIACLGEGESNDVSQTNESIYSDINDLGDYCEATDESLLIESPPPQTKSKSFKVLTKHEDHVAFYHTLERSDSNDAIGANGHALPCDTEILATSGDSIRTSRSSWNSGDISTFSNQDVNPDAEDSCGAPALPPRVLSGMDQDVKGINHLDQLLNGTSGTSQNNDNIYCDINDLTANQNPEETVEKSPTTSTQSESTRNSSQSLSSHKDHAFYHTLERSESREDL